MPEAETIEIEPAPSEQSASATSDVTDVTKPTDGELTTVPFLFDDIGKPHTQETNLSVFSTLRSAIPDHVQISHQSFARHYSVAATFGSRPSCATSESLKNNIFGVYPSEGSEVDCLVTKAQFLEISGLQFPSLFAERCTDACVKEGAELLTDTQKAYLRSAWRTCLTVVPDHRKGGFSRHCSKCRSLCHLLHPLVYIYYLIILYLLSSVL